MFNRHQAHGASVPDRPSFADPSVPSRADCCPARPMVKVIMPPTPERPHPVDLWLCGHHYRASFVALQIAGARAEDLGLAPDELDADRAPAVQHSGILRSSVPRRDAAVLTRYPGPPNGQAQWPRPSATRLCQAAQGKPSP